jgi:TPP-dependent pyruvate/acetoin dehydrogenase alpha subunit
MDGEASRGVGGEYPQGDNCVVEAARQHGLTVAEVEDWRESFYREPRTRCTHRLKDEGAVKDEQIKKLKQRIGDLVLDNDILQEALKPDPLDRKTLSRVWGENG